jgi:RNA polymerase sigma factor (TIGR02999 family)
MTAVTQILAAVEAGELHAATELLPLVYDELRKLAAAQLANEKAGQTLQPTALVHEAYVRLVGGETPQDWEGRGHFFAAAAEAMRRILVESARRKKSQKRGGDRRRADLLDDLIVVDAMDDRLVALSEALDVFAGFEPRMAELVKLRFFAGLSIEQSAELLGISPRTAKRDWTFVRAWLRRQMDREE